MWVFLLTEIMFFGGLFMAYLLYRNWYYDAFVASSNTLGIGLGTTNTAVLILSSFTMAMGVWSAEMRRKACKPPCFLSFGRDASISTSIDAPSKECS